MNSDVTVERTDSDLGSFITCAWTPAAGHALRGIVDRIWYFGGTMTHRRERTFPNGLVEIIVQLDEPHRPIEPEPGTHFPGVCVTGVHRHTTLIEAPAGACRVLGIRLDPASAWSVLRWTPAQALDQTIDLREFTGRAAADLAGRCASAPDARTCVSRAATWIAERAFDRDVRDPRIAWAAGRLRADDPAPITSLMHDVGLGASRFTQLFRDQVGVSPKRYARITRFSRTLAAIKSGAPLAAVATDFGYTDQSHLTAEFREHAGFTPSAYVRARSYDGGSLAEADNVVIAGFS
jgi:AraC-like DNA-binding protein